MSCRKVCYWEQWERTTGTGRWWCTLPEKLSFQGRHSFTTQKRRPDMKAWSGTLVSRLIISQRPWKKSFWSCYTIFTKTKSSRLIVYIWRQYITLSNDPDLFLFSFVSVIQSYYIIIIFILHIHSIKEISEKSMTDLKIICLKNINATSKKSSGHVIERSALSIRHRRENMTNTCNYWSVNYWQSEGCVFSY